MAVESELPIEVEVFGVTYERYALQQLFKRLTQQLGLRSVLEMPASGAKAMPSLYSLGFALAGCKVTLVDADESCLQVWRDLGLHQRLVSLDVNQLESEYNDGQRWDLCWNFAVLPTAEKPVELVQRMARCSNRWLMFINVNRYNVGFNIHRAVHRIWKVPWSHGDISLFSPFETIGLLKHLGFKDIKWGVVDCPPWPDSLGFRDLRLHRLGEGAHKWVSPYAKHLQENRMPGWVDWVYFFERFPLPRLLKLPYSHLYYVLCRVNNEAP